jgi:hypothetical protein
MSNSTVSQDEIHRFYRVGALGLRALQDRGFGAERFGDDAAARWKAFRGELNDSHRLNLLLRDGAAIYPLAFAARSIFALEGLADDEPFGPNWPSLLPSKAGPILREANAAAYPGAGVDALLAGLADIWGVRMQAPERSAVDAIGAASRLVLCGAGAVAAVAGQMAGRTDTDFGDQVLVVTDTPAVRQLAGIAAAVCGSRRTPRCLASGKSAADAIALGFDRATACIVSTDAEPESAETARQVADELRA